MINFYDIDSVGSVANARRERFLQEVEADRIARILRSQRNPAPGRIRRAVGARLIQAGARLSGDHSVLARRSSAMT